MLINVVNPNTTVSMTNSICGVATAAAAVGTRIRAANPSTGPISIEGYHDEAMSVPGLLAEIVAGVAAGADGHVIACFDDTGLDAARCVTSAPVVGIGEAAFHAATMVANSFGVVTTLRRSVPALRNNIVRYGFDRHCVGVRASEVAVLDIDGSADAAEAIGRQVAASIEHDGAEAVVLGCAGMAGLADALSERHGVPVIDGVAMAVKMIEALVGAGVRTSSIGGYAPPRPLDRAGREERR